jgi:hypothetical protein
MVHRILGAVAALALASPALAQAPSADWRTAETKHFRVHYTAPAEAWALHVAARLEAIRERVVAEVGYAPPEVTDVVVTDPIAQSNGMALPLLRGPRLVLWTNPPGPSAVIGTYTDWTELLALHEETHLVHMLRPSRNPGQILVEHLLPLGPITLRAPRWVHEGYATLVEGRLTASGRPNSDLRAAILRQRARAGRLPDYSQLSSDSQSWLGTSMAYLAGSAYLEWLVERTGPDSLRNLWARMTARSDRGFDQAFEGVFGEAPARLYDRFTAELAWRAVEAERRLAPVEREGELWQDLSWSTGEPAVSPDGTRLAIVLRARQKPPRLVVWSTAPDEEPEKKWRERVEKALKKDPGDVAPVRSRPLPRKPLFELPARDGADPLTPRWMPGSQAILFVRFGPDRNGFLHPDLFLWELSAGSVVRLTHLADVREPDPGPGGAWAVAVRNRNGFSQLVKIDLPTGVVSEITPPSVETVCALPRVSPDGGRVAYVSHRAGGWKLVVRELTSGREVELPVAAGASVAYPAWSVDGKVVFASAGEGGFIDVAAFPADGKGALRAVTRTIGAALAPAPTPDGSGLYFLSLQADGLDLRYMRLGEAPAASPPVARSADLAPAVRPRTPPQPAPLAVAPVAPGRRYGFGRQELAALFGGNIAPSTHAWEVGARAGDVVGRLDVLALGSIADAAGPRGGTLAGAWRGWPVAVTLQLFDATERPSQQPVTVPGLGTRLNAQQRGAELAGTWGTQWLAGGLELGAGAYLGRIEPQGSASRDERLGFVRAQVAGSPSRGRWRFPASVVARFDAGRTGGDSWRRVRSGIQVGALYGGSGLVLAWQRGSVRKAVSDLERLQLGGMPSSILPDAVLAAHVLVPALPAGTRVGDEHEGQRATLLLGGLPLFFERHHMWNQDSAKGDWLRLAGLEWDITGDPVPLVRIPGFHVTLGVAQILDAPFKGSTKAWLGLTFRP